MTYIIAIKDNRKIAIDFQKFEGTEDEVKKVLEDMIKIASNNPNTKESFDHNSLEVGGIKKKNGKLYGYAQFTNHCIDYTAIKLEDIEKMVGSRK